MVFTHLYDFIVATFRSSFINIPDQNLLSDIYLVGNFLLLIFATFFGSGTGGTSLFKR